jgi:hypothetical protein
MTHGDYQPGSGSQEFETLNCSEFCQVCTQLGELAALPVGLSQPICATCFTSVGYPISISCSFTTAIMVFTREGWIERYREKEVCNWTKIFRKDTKNIAYRRFERWPWGLWRPLSSCKPWVDVVHSNVLKPFGNWNTRTKVISELYFLKEFTSATGSYDLKLDRFLVSHKTQREKWYMGWFAYLKIEGDDVDTPASSCLFNLDIRSRQHLHYLPSFIFGNGITDITHRKTLFARTYRKLPAHFRKRKLAAGKELKKGAVQVYELC